MSTIAEGAAAAAPATETNEHEHDEAIAALYVVVVVVVVVVIVVAVAMPSSSAYLTTQVGQLTKTHSTFMTTARRRAMICLSRSASRKLRDVTVRLSSLQRSRGAFSNRRAPSPVPCPLSLWLILYNLIFTPFHVN